jgi:RNA polymerase sigma-70 factor (ECF subfamily)
MAGEPQRPAGVRSLDEEAAALLERVRAGDAQAFEVVAREHAPRLYRLAWRLTRRREDAEDLVQETLVRALPKLRRFEGRAKLSTYLIRALGNLWKNRLRSRRRSRVVEWLRGPRDDREDPPAAFDPPDTGPSPLDRLLAVDRAAGVRQAVTALSPALRWTLLLREVEEMSYEEIAACTGVPIGTVRSRLARAREDLRRLLGAGT